MCVYFGTQIRGKWVSGEAAFFGRRLGARARASTILSPLCRWKATQTSLFLKVTVVTVRLAPGTLWWHSSYYSPLFRTALCVTEQVCLPLWPQFPHLPSGTLSLFQE